VTAADEEGAGLRWISEHPAESSQILADGLAGALPKELCGQKLRCYNFDIKAIERQRCGHAKTSAINILSMNGLMFFET
jgi:hypothetical protein